MSTYSISTTDADTEDGYPEYCEEVATKAELLGVAKRAAVYGIPPHRLTVLECFGEDEVGEFESQFHNLGSLEEVTEEMRTSE